MKSHPLSFFSASLRIRVFLFFSFDVIRPCPYSSLTLSFPYLSLTLSFPSLFLSLIILVPPPYPSLSLHLIRPCQFTLSFFVPSPNPSLSLAPSFPFLSLHLIRPYPSTLSVLVPPPFVIVPSPYSSLSLAPSFPFLSLHLIRSYPSTVSVLVPVLTPPFIFLILYRSILYSKKKGKKGYVSSLDKIIWKMRFRFWSEPLKTALK